MADLKTGKIDFVVLWVDGSDPQWLEEKNRYTETNGAVSASKSAARYRDWNNMRYWFRGVEKFAPWVNNVYFVTWGHTPEWLNRNHPKLKIVNHRDFIPGEYLPTFNSNAIELNLHRIEALSEHFVLFNDDMFIINHVSEGDFFRDGKPVDEFVMNAIVPHPNMPIIGHTSVNNVGVINKYFNKRKVTRAYFSKVYSLKYRKGLIRNCLLSSWAEFTGFFNTHIPLAHLKSTFDTVWEKEEKLMHDTCVNRFRRFNDLSHWLMRYWNLCSGNFVPRRAGFGKLFTVGHNNAPIIQYITRQSGSVMCINDSSADFDFDRASRAINEAFEMILPDKSGFEI